MKIFAAVVFAGTIACVWLVWPDGVIDRSLAQVTMGDALRVLGAILVGWSGGFGALRLALSDE